MDFGTEATPLTTGFFSSYAPLAKSVEDEIEKNVNANVDIKETDKAGAITTLKATFAGISDIPQKFAFTLFYAPESTLNNADVKSSLFGKYNVPKSLRDLANILWVVDSKAVPKAIKHNGETLDKGSFEEFYEYLKGKKYLVQYFKNINTGTSTWKDPGIDVNTAGLHLLLLQPYMTDVVMQRRKVIAERSMANLTRLKTTLVLPPGFIPMAGGSKLDDTMPIEMRGAGQMFSSMRAGSLGLMGYAIGSPLNSQFSPMDNSLFISSQLSMAYENLKRNIEKITKRTDILSDDVQRQVTDSIKALKNAENEVKENRDRLTKFNEMISTGQASFGSLGPTDKVAKDDLKKSVDLYNASQQNRHKLEMRVLRVIKTLGLKYMSLV